VVPKPGSDQDLLGPLVLPVTPAKATNAVEVGIDVGDRPGLIVGAPMLRMRYSGTVPDGERPTRVYAQVVDETTGLVLGNQITPIPVTLDGRDHTVELPLEVVAHATKPGDRLTLQIVATTVAYAEPRLGGQITIPSVELTLPVAADIKPKG
jgi:ABC-2 type transport system ATP-binding protein